jgi:2,4-dienoyl-CoA reductase-like NADH-dependent reductase (Old Yellow Enzyme family)
MGSQIHDTSHQAALQVGQRKRVTDAVHAKDSFMFAQCWHGFEPHGYTDSPLYETPRPRPRGAADHSFDSTPGAVGIAR